MFRGKNQNLIYFFIEFDVEKSSHIVICVHKQKTWIFHKGVQDFDVAEDLCLLLLPFKRHFNIDESIKPYVINTIRAKAGKMIIVFLIQQIIYSQ